MWVRALPGVLLLAAFPALLVVTLAGLVVAEALLAAASAGDALRWAIVLVPAAFVLARGLRVLLGTVSERTRGVPLTEPAHQELWALVRRLAAVVGSRPPTAIRLTGEAGASVVEDTRLLGMISSRRTMLVGAPLMAVLREDQLAAVLAHELAHFANWDTRSSALAYRGRRAFASTVAALDRTELVQRLIAWLFRGWQRLYLRVSSGMSRREELTADAAAARATGSAATASALRELRVVELSWRTFTDHHLRMGWDVGYLPADVFGGYAELRAAMAERLDDVRRTPPDVVPRDNSHPAMAVRVAAVEAMADAPAVPLLRRRATELLSDAATVLDAAVLDGLGPAAAGMRRVDWVTLAEVHGRGPAVAAATALLTAAARVTGGPGTLRDVLDALDAGGLAELAGVRPTPGIGPRGRREQARPAVRDGLRAAVGLAMAGVGVAAWVPDWPACARLAADEPYAAELPDLIAAAVADRPDSTGLRALLDTVHVDLDRATAD